MIVIIAKNAKTTPTQGVIDILYCVIKKPPIAVPNETPKFPNEVCKLFANSFALGAAEIIYPTPIRKHGPYIIPQKLVTSATIKNVSPVYAKANGTINTPRIKIRVVQNIYLPKNLPAK